MTYRAPFKAPKFRLWPSGKAATMPMYGQRFRIHPEGDEYVLHHQAFGNTYERCPYDCLARFDTMEEAQAAAVEIARVAYDDPTRFQKPQWLVDLHAREREERHAKLTKRDEARYSARDDDCAPDDDFAYAVPYMTGGKGAVKTARAMTWLIEQMAPRLIGEELPESERYRLSAAAKLIERVTGRRTVQPKEGNVVQFPGTARSI